MAENCGSPSGQRVCTVLALCPSPFDLSCLCKSHDTISSLACPSLSPDLLFANVSTLLQMPDICPLPAHVLLHGHNAATVTGIMGKPQGAFLMIHRDKPGMLGTERRDVPGPGAQHFSASKTSILLGEASFNLLSIYFGKPSFLFSLECLNFAMA